MISSQRNYWTNCVKTWCVDKSSCLWNKTKAIFYAHIMSKRFSRIKLRWHWLTPSIFYFQNLKGYLDSSKNGVIYVSYGSNIELSLLPQPIIQILLNVLSRLPYDVLLRWEKDSLPYHCDNIKIVKWTPQAELLSKYFM